jgi:hypothetical protein
VLGRIGRIGEEVLGRIGRIGEEVLGEFWTGILVQFLRLILDSFLDDSRVRFARIQWFSDGRRLILTRFWTRFYTFISAAFRPDFSEQLFLTPTLEILPVVCPNRTVA